MKTITVDNFHINTNAIFEPCTKPDRAPDFVSNSGSQYWYTNNGVVRNSDHWTGQHGCNKIVQCLWAINAPFPHDTQICGFCNFDDFFVGRNYKVREFKIAA